ncbi:MAG: DNA cytosine methyltransferase [Betaproteobacteria bacterium]|nr:DNA cytosine methyltransferase [Betaproteobacteria bacterium]
MKPLAIEIFSGLHGWGAGLAAAGFRVVGFDIVDMPRLLGHPVPEHCSLVLQDVLTLHGSQFRDAHLIVASPPCQRYSYMAMPFSRGKRLAAEIRADEPGEKLRDLNALLEACFRIQRRRAKRRARYPARH